MRGSDEHVLSVVGAHLPGYVTGRAAQNRVYALRVRQRLEEFDGEAPPEHYGRDSDVIEPRTPRAEFASGIAIGELDLPQRVLTELGRCLETDEALFWRAVDWCAPHAWGRSRAADVARVVCGLRLGQRDSLPGE